MTQDAKHKFIFVLGHESSGTRLIADTITRASGYDYDDGENRADEKGKLIDSFLSKEVHQWYLDPSKIICDKSRISRRSLPHGGTDNFELEQGVEDKDSERAFFDPLPLIKPLEAAGYDVRVVLTVRDRNIAVNSKCREHTLGDRELADTEMDRALAITNALLENHDKCFVCSYESLMTLGKPYLQKLYDFLGVESEYEPVLKDGNTKYIPEFNISKAKSMFTLNVGIVTRPDEHQWGGDLRALHSAKEGLEQLGVSVIMGKRPSDLLHCDFIFLSNTCMDQRENMGICKENNIPYGLFGFHEDFLNYYGQSMGFTEYISMCMQQLEDNGVKLDIEDLWGNPHLFNFYNHEAPKNILYNIPVLRDAELCVAAAHREAGYMKRDCPTAKTSVVYWNVPLLPGSEEYSDEFLQLTGLKKGEYILQVGRLETRKNQLGTVLASKNLDIPLVMIATKGYQDWYDLLVVNAAAKYRKAPTILLSEEHPTQVVGNEMRIQQMPGGQRLSERCLISAYQNCGLHMHPAFWEAPGYTYLEAAKIGVPTVASEWGTLQDYCEFGGNEPTMGGRFAYVCPYNLPQMEQAIKDNFGKELDPNFTHPIFDRTERDVGRDLLHAMVEHVL